MDLDEFCTIFVFEVTDIIPPKTKIIVVAIYRTSDSVLFKNALESWLLVQYTMS